MAASRQGLTDLQFSGCHSKEVHVVQTHHVDDPHLLVVGWLDLVQLAGGGRASTSPLSWGHSAKGASQEPRNPKTPFLSHTVQTWDGAQSYH